MTHRRTLVALAGLLVLSLTSSGISQESARSADPMVGDLRWRNIGPATMSGRVSSIDALESNFAHVVVGSASGGVWKSTNAGTTWTPIFDDYPVASIGDVALFQPDPNLIWVGTGEECGRNSVSWGNGVYRSTNGGETFEHMGLTDTYAISKVLTHPSDRNVVYVAAAGDLWSTTNGTRGVFKTTDGGASWSKLTAGLPTRGHAGAIDLIMHPQDPETLWVGMYERLRLPYDLRSGGPNGGIFKTTNGGRSWTKLTEGLPEGDSGRIGLAVSRSNPRVLMAMYEHGFRPQRGDDDYEDMTKLGSGLYRSEDGGQSWTYVNRYHSRPFYFNHVWINPIDDQMVYVLANQIQVSEDGGRTLRRIEASNYHPCFHAMWLDPHNRDRFYAGNDGGAGISYDNGENVLAFDNIPLSQFYMIDVDMREPYWVFGGLQDNYSWGGPSNSRDRMGIPVDSWYTISSGDGFHVQIDPTDWRIVYSEPHPGASGGSIQRENVETRESTVIRPRTETIVNYREYVTREMEQRQEELNWPTAFRYNWSTPIVLSPHNPSTVYIGANHLFKSVDRGDTWRIISPDLSNNDPDKVLRVSGGLTPDHDPGGGAENHGTIIAISESPVVPGIIWAGTDDGNLQVTSDGGVTWSNVVSKVPGVPGETWVSRVVASRFDAETAYVSFDGHRRADRKPYIFKTTDLGQTWTPAMNGIAAGSPVHVVTEDTVNPNLLFAGTEFGAYYSLDAGSSWSPLELNMPTVAVHDLVVHPRDGDLVAGTHGRGIWILDDITALQQLEPEVAFQNAVLFDSRTATQWADQSRGGFYGDFVYHGENPPDAALIHFYLAEAQSVRLEISDITGEQRHTATIDGRAGINRYAWNMRFGGQQARGGRGTPQNASGGRGGRAQGRRGGRGRGGRGRGGPRAEPGTFQVVLTVGEEEFTGTVALRRDPLLETGR